MKRFLLILFFLLFAYLILYKIYIPRVSAFGCFDDCFNLAAGYFLNQGKILYTEIFYNHQMLPAYISSVVQNVSQPINIFDLVLQHRQFVMLFGFVFNLLLIFRFGIPAFLFFIFFELSKFYIFGDRFLGEAILIYPLVYLIFVAYKRLQKEKIQYYDFILSSIFAWSIIFLRETFIPLSLILYLYILFPYRNFSKYKILSVTIFLLLTVTSLLSVNFKDYYFNLWEVNRDLIAQSQINILTSLFYPLHILVSSSWNLFRSVLVVIDLLFLVSLFYLVIIKREYKYLLIFIVLTLSNIRSVEPGRLFYESFHMVPFYGIFLSLTFLLVWEIKKYNRKIWNFSMIITSILFLYYVLSPQAFFKEKIDRHGEFFTNYSNILQAGEIVKIISLPKDSLFVDGYDEVIYWVANRPSSYKYSMYTSLMPNVSIYKNERLEMFKNNSPVFYYGSCPEEESTIRLIPREFANNYVRLNAFGKPSCIFVKEKKLNEVTNEQWKKAKEFGYELPVDN